MPVYEISILASFGDQRATRTALPAESEESSAETDGTLFVLVVGLSLCIEVSELPLRVVPLHEVSSETSSRAQKSWLLNKDRHSIIGGNDSTLVYIEYITGPLFAPFCHAQVGMTQNAVVFATQGPPLSPEKDLFLDMEKFWPLRTFDVLCLTSFQCFQAFILNKAHQD